VDDTVRVSVASNGAGGGLGSYGPAISADGRFVAFSSGAPNLVAGDSGDSIDVFVRDRRAGETELVSVTREGRPAGTADQAAISADGGVVAFTSHSDRIVAGDTNGKFDLFVRDLDRGVTERLTALPPDVEWEPRWSVSAASLSADGRFVAYTVSGSTGTTREADVYVYDRRTDVAERVGGLEDAGGSHKVLSAPTISADGNVVAYRTYERIGGGYHPEPNDSDVFVHDRRTGVTQTVDRETADDTWNTEEPPALSADGRFVAFSSRASDLVPGDTNGDPDVFVHDRVLGSTERVTPPGRGEAGRPTLSSDGRHVGFEFSARQATTDEVYLHDRATGESVLVSGADPHADAQSPVLAAGGRYLAFVWSAPRARWDRHGDDDVYVHRISGGNDGFDSHPGTVSCPDATSATVTCRLDRQGRMVLDGTPRDETLVGTGSADILRGGRGADFLTARGGADRLLGGWGADALKGGGGIDRLSGGHGGDLLGGGARRDHYVAGPGSDRVDSGGQRREVVACGSGADRVRGAKADRVRSDCESVRRWGGYQITDANRR
jgi:Tol biopolymer transport system component